jgi:hypothetical protein
MDGVGRRSDDLYAMRFPAPDQFRHLLVFAAFAAHNDISNRDHRSTEALLEALVCAAWPTQSALKQ